MRNFSNKSGTIGLLALNSDLPIATRRASLLQLESDFGQDTAVNILLALGSFTTTDNLVNTLYILSFEALLKAIQSSMKAGDLNSRWDVGKDMIRGALKVASREETCEILTAIIGLSLQKPSRYPLLLIGDVTPKLWTLYVERQLEASQNNPALTLRVLEWLSFTCDHLAQKIGDHNSLYYDCGWMSDADYIQKCDPLFEQIYSVVPELTRIVRLIAENRSSHVTTPEIKILAQHILKRFTDLLSIPRYVQSSRAA